MLLTIVADDLTGACDAGALFTGRGRVDVFVAPDAPGGDGDAVVVDTVTRALDPVAARARVREVAGRIAPRLTQGRLFKKIDSTMRGHVGAEVDALLEATAFDSAVVCPAFPEQGRQVLGGVLTVDGRPAHETPVGRDPLYPGPTSHVPDMLAAGTSRPVVHLPLAEVRDAGPELARLLRRAPGGLVVPDAATPADLDALARAALHHRRFLVAGSAGLARAVALLFSAQPLVTTLPAGRAWLVVAGSAHPACHAQLEALVAIGARAAWLDRTDRGPARGPLVGALAGGEPIVIAARPPATPAPAGSRLAMAEALARAAVAVVEERSPDLLVVVGGETLHALFRAWGAPRLQLVGSPAPGLALGDLAGSGGLPPVAVLTKAGAFGGRDLWTRLLGAHREGMS